MEAMDGSPNWYWNRLGARIEREGKGRKRTVYVNEIAVSIHNDQDMETKIAKRIYNEIGAKINGD